MRWTWPGARSGNISITTLPLVVSMTSAFSGSLISAISLFLFLFVTVGGDPHLDHAIRRGDGAIPGGIALLDLVDILHAAHDIADDGIIAFERRRRREHDEELRIGGIRILRARHADRPPHIG